MNKKPAILGGSKTRNTPLVFRKTIGEEEKNAVMEVMDSDVLSAFIGAPGEKFLGGKKVLEFENNWKKEYGFKHAISVNSWTSGLIICVGALGIEPGDEVICSPWTMSASATSVLFYGGIPVFADIHPETYNIHPTSIESKITERTKAILVVHILGQCADMDGIMKLAKKYNLKVIEDAAQAPGIKYKGKPIGGIGDIGGFSLNFHKHIHTGEGGMIVTNDDNLAFKSQLIRNHGENYASKLKINDLTNIIGGNYRLTELQAAIGIVQLKKLQKIISHRKILADFLHNEIKKIDCLETFPSIPEIEHSYYGFVIKFNKELAGISRPLFVKSVNAEFLDADGWECVPLAEGYGAPLYLNPIYQNQIAIGSKGFPFNYNNNVKYDYSKGICPVVEDMYYEKAIISPIVREPLTISDMQDFINAIKKVLLNAKQIKKEFKGTIPKDVIAPVDLASSEKNDR